MFLILLFQTLVPCRKYCSLDSLHLCIAPTPPTCSRVILSCISSHKRYIHLPNPFKKRQNFSLLDKVPSDFQLIYSNTLSGYMAYFYPVVMLGTAVVVTSAIYGTLIGPLSHTALVQKSGFDFTDPLHSIVMVSTATTLALIIFAFVKRCPMRIYYNENTDEFIGIYATLAPWKVRHKHFQSGSVKCLNDFDEDSHFTGVLMTFRGIYMISDNERLVLFPNCFKLPIYYNIMLGYSKIKNEED